MTIAEKILTVEDFNKIPMFFYASIGVQPYQKVTRSATSFLSNFIFYFGIFNLNLCVLGEFIYLYFAFGSFSTFLEATALAPCIGFCLVADFKMLAVWWHKNTLSEIMQELSVIFPKTLELQREFKLLAYERQMKAMIIPFAILFMVLIWLFNLMNLAMSTWQYLFMATEFKRVQAYFIWYPFDETSISIFPIIYTLQVHAGYVAAVGTLAADLLLCCVVTQLCMHFDFISKRMQEYLAKGFKNDLTVLNLIIRHHITCLSLGEKLNDVFGFSLFLNFSTSSIIICLVGFQVTAGVEIADLIKYMFFLVSALIQVFMICYYGTLLIDASSNIANASYNQNWMNANIRYKKSLILVIQRSQKAVILNAPIYNKISLEVFTTVMSMSYQFFALLKTMYSPE